MGRSLPNPPREPVRTCVACRQEGDKSALVRVVRRADGTAAVDRTGHAPGRGAYLHSDPDCVEVARKRKALERSLKASIGPEVWSGLIQPSTQVGE
jgi:predicted RNA-binding protein YlxR (DUF448 family)